MVLALALLYEITLGRKSYWYPYLISMPTVTFTPYWDFEALKCFDDVQMMQYMRASQADIEQSWS